MGTYWSGAALGSRRPCEIYVSYVAQSWQPYPSCTAARAPSVTGSCRVSCREVILRLRRKRPQQPGLHPGPYLFKSGGRQLRRTTNRDTRGWGREKAILQQENLRGRKGCAASPMSRAFPFIRFGSSSISNKSHNITPSSGAVSRRRRTGSDQDLKWPISCFLFARWSYPVTSVARYYLSILVRRGGFQAVSHPS